MMNTECELFQNIWSSL